MITRLLAWLRRRLHRLPVRPGDPIRHGNRIVGVVDEVHDGPDGIHMTGRITDPALAELLSAGMPEFSISAEPGTPQPEISDWADNIARELCSERLVEGGDINVLRGMLFAATADEQLAYEVLVALSRQVGLLLRPAGWAGGVIGLDAERAQTDDPVYLRAAQLVGFGAAGDAAMVDAIARATVTIRRPFADADEAAALLEVRSTLWSILEVLAREPIVPDPQGDLT